MPNGQQRLPAQKATWGANSSLPAEQFAVLAKTLLTNRFQMPARNRDKLGNQVSWLEFPKD
jgi:hypothetical protein